MTVKISSLGQDRRQIFMEEERLFALNNELLKNEGLSLIDLAEKDPNQAYTFIRQALGFIASNYAKDITDNGKQLAAIDKDGPEVTCQIAHRNFMRLLPATYEQAWPMTVDIHLLATDNDPFSVGQEPLIRLAITPPNLASI